jgi:uncharacterized membrane protein YfcA
MSPLWLVLLGAMAGTGAGLLAGLVGIGGGIVVVPVVYYGLIDSGLSVDQAVHIAVATSLAAILPASIVSFLAHWRAGNADLGFLRQWGPGIAIGVVVAQIVAPYVDGRLLAALFGSLCLTLPFGSRFRSASGHWSISRRVATSATLRAWASALSPASPEWAVAFSPTSS